VSAGKKRTLGCNGAAKAPDAAAVRRQVELVLSDPLFSNSKRYPVLLRFVAERALSGQISDIRERALGIELFDRKPDYDTEADPVVRVTMHEVRKRLVQYYADPSHSHELRIDLPAGSYIPEFLIPGLPTETPKQPFGGNRIASALSGKKPLVLRVVCTAMAVVALFWWSPWNHRSALERFWAPLVESPGDVLVCVGQHYGGLHASADGAVLFRDRPMSAERFSYLLSRGVILDDAEVAQSLGGLLGSLRKKTLLRGMETTSLADLKEHASIFIGDPFHEWVRRILENARYSIGFENGTIFVRDKQSPENRQWSRKRTENSGEDYGIVLRHLDPVTGRQVVLATGTYNTGTAAASDVLSSSKLMELAFQGARAGWDHRNIEIVVRARVMNNFAGVPTPVAVHVW
jgi:hypothetical protein